MNFGVSVLLPHSGWQSQSHLEGTQFGSQDLALIKAPRGRECVCLVCANLTQPESPGSSRMNNHKPTQHGREGCDFPNSKHILPA